jgi:hypothetical protein
MELKAGLARKLDRINLETRFGSVEDTTNIASQRSHKAGHADHLRQNIASTRNKWRPYLKVYRAATKLKGWAW